jgi:hypothetical protein
MELQTMRLPKIIVGQSPQQRRINKHRALLRHLARIGGTVFGPIPAGHRREFFCLDKHTWVWHEEWNDQTGQHRAMTTRYDVRPSGILKSQGVSSYQRLSATEEANFRQAVKAYRRVATVELQRLVEAA